MITQYTSVKEVMGRVVRNVGGKLPSHFYDSMLEWIAEGIRMMQTKHQLITKSSPNCDEEGALVSRQHVVPFPHDMIAIKAVEDEKGRRVREALDITDMTNQTTRYHRGTPNSDSQGARATNFQVDVFDHQGADPQDPPPGQAVPYDGSDIKKADLPESNLTYKLQGNMIQTSIESAFIKLHYLALNLDAEGYLMVPDIEEYKQALTYYILRNLVGAGMTHPVWNGPPGYQYFDREFEKYMARALGKVKMPNTDRLERLRVSFAERIVPPRHFYADFFIGGEQTQDVYYI